MTTKDAIKLAWMNSAEFRNSVYRINQTAKMGDPAVCQIFSTAPGETFYYGYDGVSIVKGKHSLKRAAYLLKSEQALICWR